MAQFGLEREHAVVGLFGVDKGTLCANKKTFRDWVDGQTVKFPALGLGKKKALSDPPRPPTKRTGGQSTSLVFKHVSFKVFIQSLNHVRFVRWKQGNLAYLTVPKKCPHVILLLCLFIVLKNNSSYNLRIISNKNIWTYLPICQVPSHLLFSFALVRLQSIHSEHIQSNQCHQETKSINIVLIVQYLLLFEELGRLLGRALIIGWRKNSWNPERVPSVVTFLCVCVSVCL